jgi:NTP pyrophosphatase (non-canonical NTP hydrolase)
MQDKVNQVVNRQIEFQKTMDADFDEMYLAIVEELGEYVASSGYATWKQVNRDEDNMKIELVDIAVFAINLAYYKVDIYKPFPERTITTEVDLIKQLIAYLAREDFSSIYHNIFWYDSSLLDIITAKQALNRLRQDYGYKDGSYIKDWNGKEDNVYLEKFYGQSYDDVYNAMEIIYTKKIIASRLVNVDD